MKISMENHKMRWTKAKLMERRWFFNVKKPKTMGKQSKIWVQGSNQSLICMFVFQELPLLYKEVCLRKPTFSSLNPPKKTTRAKPLPFQCNLCKKKTTFKSMPDMKMHMKVTHKNTDITPQRKPTRAIGRPNVINISVSSDLLDSENDLTLDKSVSL